MQGWSWLQTAGSMMPSIVNPYLLVGVGGATGSVFRFAVGRTVAMVLPGVSPLMATGIVNLVGSFLLGCVIAGMGETHRSHPGVLLLGVGVCGGFTTFSTFAMELADLMHERQYWIATGYGLGSVLLGVVGFVAGAWVVQRWVSG